MSSLSYARSLTRVLSLALFAFRISSLISVQEGALPPSCHFPSLPFHLDDFIIPRPKYYLGPPHLL